MSTIRQGFNYTRIVTATTTTVKSGPGCLKRITVNSAVASSVFTLYDNTAGSGTVIGVITMPATLLQSHFDLEYDIRFAVGLTIVSSSTADVTVVWA